MRKSIILLSFFATMFCVNNAYAQENKSDNSEDKSKSQQKELSALEVATQLSNPVAKLISLPIENDVDFGIGKMNGTRNTTNIQPVIPFQISDNLNMITRVVLPIVTQYNITGPESRQSGLTDTQISVFISPISKKSNGLIWGIGPIISTPTGTNEFLTTKKWGAGPSAVALVQNNGWTFGALVNQVWSFAGDKNRDDINRLFFEPFTSYHWKSGAGILFIGEYIQDWEHNTSNMFLQASLSGLTSIGNQKVQIFIGPRISLFGPSESRSSFGITGGITLPFAE